MKILKRRRNARQRCYPGQGDHEDTTIGKQKPSAGINHELFNVLQNYILLCMLSCACALVCPSASQSTAYRTQFSSPTHVGSWSKLGSPVLAVSTLSTKLSHCPMNFFQSVFYVRHYLLFSNLFTYTYFY